MTQARSRSCVLVGRESLLIQCGQILLGQGFEIRAVASGNPAILDWAAALGIPGVPRPSGLPGLLDGTPFDYLFSVTNFAVLPEPLLALPVRRAVNFHDAPIRRYAGLNTPAWALMHGESEWAVTWHEMTAEVDRGAILREESFEIAPDETSFTLNAKCYEAGIRSFAALVEELATDRVQPIEQEGTGQNYFARDQRPEAACVIEWTRPATEIAARIRALDFGPYANPLGIPKLRLGPSVYGVARASLAGNESAAAPGTLLASDTDSITVAAGDGAVRLSGFTSIEGSVLAVENLLGSHGISRGERLPILDGPETSLLELIQAALAPHEGFWSRRLAKLPALGVPGESRSDSAGQGAVEFEWALSDKVTDWLADPDPGDPVERLQAAIGLLLMRANATDRGLVGGSDEDLRRLIEGGESLFSAQTPLRFELKPGETFRPYLERVRSERLRVRKHGSFGLDLPARFPELEAYRFEGGLEMPVVVRSGAGAATDGPTGRELTLVIGPGAERLHGCYVPGRVDGSAVSRLESQFSALLEGLAAKDDVRLDELPLVGAEELERLLSTWNQTDKEYPSEFCVHQLFELQAGRTPDAIALVFRETEWTYRELNERANALAHYLLRLNVGPGTLVGVCTERSLDLMVAALGIHKAGGAYVPIDPTYPADRLALMIQDSGVPVLVTQKHLVSALPPHEARVICIDSEWEAIQAGSRENPESGVTSQNLAYVIYTSGSTGRPKGVMVEHRNVVNFFSGMDDWIQHDPPGVWLAVTSLSFDISVLELFWTLTRGFKVVIYADGARTPAGESARTRYPDRPVQFSLFYFASDEGEQAADKYRLLMEGAKFADRNGFSAVWTPERHFHAFGGLYPNPSVVSAAIAAVTERVQIRSGSVVLPLHHPIRVAEEWSLVDNLSQGRVGISFAAGWQPNDFVLDPESFSDAKQVMVDRIDVVRRLWRGETVSFPGPKGDVEIRTLPRPIQPELPFWITTAGNPETFRLAGEQGAFVLTHLLGQNIDELDQKLEIYRTAWKQAGHPGAGHVSLMLHAFVAPDEQFVRDRVRNPLKGYLRSAANLIRHYASSFPAFKTSTSEVTQAADVDFEKMSEDDMEALLEHSFQRYYETSGLFGTPQGCVEMVDRLKEIQVDEIACLIDFGVASETVLRNLKHLDDLRRRCTAEENRKAEDLSFAAQLVRHRVTHFQCTPSMATMLVADAESSAALGSLRQMLVGGEAFPVPLAQRLGELVPGRLLNMYGPTETTIWSSVQQVGDGSGSVPIGRPIANTRIYILDSSMQPVPQGAIGELFIGGDGVVRGYLGRQELTDERFLPDPFVEHQDARIYRTGDLARYRNDGTLEFLGRVDHQVKIRGYRVELGEIEAVLLERPEVGEAAVVLREDAEDDRRIVAYVVPANRNGVDPRQLRNALKQRLPEYMVPTNFLQLDALPLTPNKKIDRNVLPAPDQVRPSAVVAPVSPANELEQTIAGIWQTVLNVPSVGVEDNFFDLGGHSLLVVQVLSRLREVTGKKLPMTELFRFPTIRALAASLDGGAGNAAVDASQDRAAVRRDSMRRRRRTRG